MTESSPASPLPPPERLGTLWSMLDTVLHPAPIKLVGEDSSVELRRAPGKQYTAEGIRDLTRVEQQTETGIQHTTLPDIFSSTDDVREYARGFLPAEEVELLTGTAPEMSVENRLKLTQRLIETFDPEKASLQLRKLGIDGKSLEYLEKEWVVAGLQAAAVMSVQHEARNSSGRSDRRKLYTEMFNEGKGLQIEGDYMNALKREPNGESSPQIEHTVREDLMAAQQLFNTLLPPDVLKELYDMQAEGFAEYNPQKTRQASQRRQQLYQSILRGYGVHTPETDYRNAGDATLADSIRKRAAEEVTYTNYTGETVTKARGLMNAIDGNRLATAELLGLYGATAEQQALVLDPTRWEAFQKEKKRLQQQERDAYALAPKAGFRFPAKGKYYDTLIQKHFKLAANTGNTYLMMKSILIERLNTDLRLRGIETDTESRFTRLTGGVLPEKLTLSRFRSMGLKGVEFLLRRSHLTSEPGRLPDEPVIELMKVVQGPSTEERTKGILARLDSARLARRKKEGKPMRKEPKEAKQPVEEADSPIVEYHPDATSSEKEDQEDIPLADADTETLPTELTPTAEREIGPDLPVRLSNQDILLADNRMMGFHLPPDRKLRIQRAATTHARRLTFKDVNTYFLRTKNRAAALHINRGAFFLSRNPTLVHVRRAIEHFQKTMTPRDINRFAAHNPQRLLQLKNQPVSPENRPISEEAYQALENAVRNASPAQLTQRLTNNPYEALSYNYLLLQTYPFSPRIQEFVTRTLQTMEPFQLKSYLEQHPKEVLYMNFDTVFGFDRSQRRFTSPLPDSCRLVVYDILRRLRIGDPAKPQPDILPKDQPALPEPAEEKRVAIPAGNHPYEEPTYSEDAQELKAVLEQMKEFNNEPITSPPPIPVDPEDNTPAALSTALKDIAEEADEFPYTLEPIVLPETADANATAVTLTNTISRNEKMSQSRKAQLRGELERYLNSDLYKYDGKTVRSYRLDTSTADLAQSIITVQNNWKNLQTLDSRIERATYLDPIKNTPATRIMLESDPEFIYLFERLRKMEQTKSLEENDRIMATWRIYSLSSGSKKLTDGQILSLLQSIEILRAFPELHETA